MLEPYFDTRLHTIYGYQDIKDDEIIGVKSTSIKFKNNPKKFLSLCYVITFISIIIIGMLMNLNNFYFLFLYSYAFIFSNKNIEY